MMKSIDSPSQTARRRLLANRRWVDENLTELINKHAGRWVAVVDGQVAKIGDSPGEVRQIAEERGEEVLLMRIPSEKVRIPI